MVARNFAAALAHVLRQEGGYVDHPADPGGATNLGITLGALAAWRGRPVSTAEVRALTRAEAAAIYRARYWDAIVGDALPAGLDLCLFDCAVNSGPGRAIRLLQKVLGVAEDGMAGPLTRAALAARPPMALIDLYMEARGAFLARLPTYPVFGRGWRRRLADTRSAARILARAPADAPTSDNRKKDAPMFSVSKSILASRTIIANLVGLGALAAAAFGFDTGALDANALTESVLQIVTAGSLIASSVFRVLATRRLA